MSVVEAGVGVTEGAGAEGAAGTGITAGVGAGATAGVVTEEPATRVGVYSKYFSTGLNVRVKVNAESKTPVRQSSSNNSFTR